MTSPYDFLQRLSRLDVHREIHNSLLATQEEGVALQTAQLFSGVKNDETPIAPPYTAFTIAIKKKKGQPFDRVTGKDKGSMYANTFAEVDNSNTVYFGSESDTAPKFIARYGDKVFGLTPSNTDKLRDQTEPVFRESVKNALLL